MLGELGYDLSGHIDRHFAKLATIGNTPDGSISRIAYSDAESTAMAYVRAEGEALGLAGTYDGIGNLLLRMPGQYGSRVLVGSHLDSVPFGGNYDGAAGVVAAIEAIRTILASATPLRRAIDIVAWRGEEYTFNAAYKGSAAAFGMSEPHILRNRYGDRSLREAILQQGFDPSHIDECRPSFSADYVDNLHAYLELHIEQGEMLERARKDVGVVTDIAGDRRFLVVLEGRFDHSGATPMGTRHRSDVNLTMAYMQTRLDALAKKRRDEGQVFAQTVGIINADPEITRKYPAVVGNSVTKVSGLGYFTIDIMSSDDAFMDSYSAEALRLIWQTAKELGTKAIVEQTDSAAGVPRLDADIQDRLEASAQAVSASCMRLSSGAGHDAVVVTRSKRSNGVAIPVGMLFVPCRGGVSHSKDEYASADQIAKGTRVLAHALLEICGVA